MKRFCSECGRELKENEKCNCLDYVQSNSPSNIIGVVYDGPPRFGLLTEGIKDVSLERCIKLNGKWISKDKKHVILFKNKEFKFDDLKIYVEAYEDNTLRFVNLEPDKNKITKIIYEDSSIDVYIGEEKIEFIKIEDNTSN